jgi:hypothetical protein
LTTVERQALFGDESDQFPSAAWLGNLSQAATARQNLVQDDPASTAIQAAVTNALQGVSDGLTDSDLQAIGAAYRALDAIHRVGHAVATRYLTLRRPDACVSVNAASEESLAQILGVQQLHTWLGYQEGLRRLWQAPWMTAPRPTSTSEQWIWENRAGLLDAFAFSPANGQHPQETWV